MQTVNVEVVSETKFLQHIKRSAFILRNTKIIHCYLDGNCFVISYYSGIMRYVFSKNKNEIISYASKAMKIIQEQLTITKILNSVE